jgi:hypothetical protein
LLLTLRLIWFSFGKIDQSASVYVLTRKIINRFVKETVKRLCHFRQRRNWGWVTGYETWANDIQTWTVGLIKLKNSHSLLSVWMRLRIVKDVTGCHKNSYRSLISLYTGEEEDNDSLWICHRHRALWFRSWLHVSSMIYCFCHGLKTFILHLNTVKGGNYTSGFENANEFCWRNAFHFILISYPETTVQDKNNLAFIVPRCREHQPLAS